MRQTTTAKVRFEADKGARFNASAQSTYRFDQQQRTQGPIYRCPKRLTGRSWPHQPR